jgi:hypothetical protein
LICINNQRDYPLRLRHGSSAELSDYEVARMSRDVDLKRMPIANVLTKFMKSLGPKG